MDKNSEELKNLFEECATPRKEFAENLRTQVVSQSHMEKPQSNFISQLFMKLSQPALRIGAMVSLLAVGASVATYMYMNQTPKSFANQTEILAKIAQANESTKRETTSNAPTAMGAAQDSKISALYIRVPEDRTYNYKQIVTSYDIGNAAAKCSQIVPYQGAVSKEELTEYFSTKDESYPKYTKNVVFANSDIYDYNLSIDTDQWLYRGGEYAVHLTNVQRMIALAASDTPSLLKNSNEEVAEPNMLVAPDTNSKIIALPPEENPQPTVAPTDPNDVIKNYFGEDAKIIGTETKGGKEYYKIQWSYKSTCGDLSTSPNRSISSSSAELDQTFVTVAYADSKDFTINKESQYIDSVANRNLLYTRTTEETRKTVSSFDEIKDEFTYSYAKPVKTIDASAFQYEKEYRKAMLEYLSKNMTSVVYMTGKVTLQSLYSTFVTVIPDQEKHLIDRAFYSEKEFGTTLFNDSKDMFKPFQEMGKTYPKVQLSYAGTGAASWISVSEVTGALSGNAALGILGYEGSTFVPKSNVTITVSGEKIPAQVFELDQSANSSPGSTGTGVDDGITNDPAMTVPQEVKPRVDVPLYKDVFFVFTQDDVTVVVQTSVASKVANSEIAKGLNFTTVLTSDQTLLGKALAVATVSVPPVMYAK